ncbi:hypothetical protein GDO86_006705 [Hymenochirus boettgeri]|uniref:Olfactory receptor n=1 Tax=Hymenochirus boettgeri TaxID=247094 RepID=A0A8T2JC45_9PIPI|nr:hypothetical protein GDO86_006705 [Hymenochirus boettgeri]
MSIEFHLLAFTKYEDIWLVVFIGLLLMYLITVSGNLIITAIVFAVPNLHTPMYFFLCSLAVQDIIYVSAIIPKLLDITLTGQSTMSFQNCITQSTFYAVCILAEFFLLASMSYDRYVAICKPLRYLHIMKKEMCALLVLFPWTVASLNSLAFSIRVSNLQFNGSQEINHLFCESKSLLMYSCSDTSDLKIFIMLESIVLGFIPFTLILTSYGYIISAILKIKTSQGRLKTFSTCSSHLTIVILFCGTTISFYLSPEGEQFQERNKVISLFYTVLIPMLNPLVYSFRNKDVMTAIKKIFN